MSRGRGQTLGLSGRGYQGFFKTHRNSCEPITPLHEFRIYPLDNRKHQKKFGVILLSIFLGSLLVMVITWQTLSVVSVNGTLYKRIVQGKDLIADILPPPEYIIETNMIAMQMLEEINQQKLQELMKSFDRLKSDYFTRHKFWADNLEEGSTADRQIRDMMLTTSYEPAMKYYSLMDEKYIPAIKSGDRDAAAILLHGALNEAYAAHRQGIDKVVELANVRVKNDEHESASTIFNRTLLLFLSVLLSLLAATGASFIVIRTIVGDLQRATATAQSGDLSLRLDVTTKDELGELCRAFDIMSDRLQRKTEEATAIANGDLTVKIEVASDRDTLGKSFENMLASLIDLVRQVQRSVGEVTAGSGQVSTASQSLSQGATETASSLEEVSSSMTEISSQTKSNAENAGKADELVRAASLAATEGKGKIATTVSAMNEINTSSQEIAKIIKVIDDIAFQTNLLALNAAVEAARAGRHGKGFAVVADEVRNLAGRSAKAAKETAELIESAKQKADVGLNVANETAKAFEEIVKGVMSVTELVAGIATSSNEQARGIAQISSGLSQIDQVTQQNTATAEETASAAEELSSQAQTLQHLIGKFKLTGHGEEATIQAHTETSALNRRLKVLPKPQTNAQKGWGNVTNNSKVERATNPQEQITLNNNEFGKFSAGGRS